MRLMQRDVLGAVLQISLDGDTGNIASCMCSIRWCALLV